MQHVKGLIPGVQELLGHKDMSTTMIYMHVLNRGGRGVKIPLGAASSSIWSSCGAEGGSRTRTSFRTTDFKSRDRAIT